MADKSEEPAPSKSGRRFRWWLVGIAIVALAIISGRAPEGGTSGGSSGGAQRCTVTVTADVLNVRAGPGTAHPAVDRLSRGDVVDAQRETSGGFRKLADTRWVADEFVRPSAGCTAP
jgi:uncharacterized protein YgiM (DUF1202 family)